MLLLLTLNNTYAADIELHSSTIPSNSMSSKNITINSHEDFFIRSLNPGAGSDQSNLQYFSDNKCKERKVKCYLLLSALGNLLIDHGDQENGLKSAIYGYELIHDTDYCPVAYEIVAINYKLNKLNNTPPLKASNEARSIIYKVKNSGGFSNNLKTNSCKSLKQKSPIYFEKYEELIRSLSLIAQ